MTLARLGGLQVDPVQHHPSGVGPGPLRNVSTGTPLSLDHDPSSPMRRSAAESVPTADSEQACPSGIDRYRARCPFYFAGYLARWLRVPVASQPRRGSARVSGRRWVVGVGPTSGIAGRCGPLLSRSRRTQRVTGRPTCAVLGCPRPALISSYTVRWPGRPYGARGLGHVLIPVSSPSATPTDRTGYRQGALRARGALGRNSVLSRTPTSPFHRR